MVLGQQRRRDLIGHLHHFLQRRFSPTLFTASGSDAVKSVGDERLLAVFDSVTNAEQRQTIVVFKVLFLLLHLDPLLKLQLHMM